MIINAASQPQFSAIHGTVSGARIAPTLAPELKIPVANDLSFLGKYSAVALMAAGKFPASPKPSTARENIKPITETGTAQFLPSLIRDIMPFPDRNCQCMNDSTNRPDDYSPGISFFGAQLINDSAGKQHGDSISKLENGSILA